jgi:16S rRNA (guanine966-N2)-methyltransferase
MSLRIIAGAHRGRKLIAPEGKEIRPTSSRAREALFNILAHGFAGDDGASLLIGARVLDAFAGTGALGLEALSRGAAFVTFMDAAPQAMKAVSENLRAMNELPKAAMVRADAANPPPARQSCTLIFLDPPYRSGLIPKALTALREKNWIAPEALICAELAAKEDFDLPPGFAAVDERRYGAAKVVLIKQAAQSS